ncbi:SpoIIE family protein phosphatase [Desulfatitalea alkaliphila]|uniref:SpoIIE family protein phosphatase n=1 Tax=Desulfatitalea alkaliphila TaxID=2929485 RepID=A0AA41UIC8_9BACT|nr:SpoIIE family protein phosphatase [Desulfatitalea alkaliphila]MCJ8499467.1 SpoIIE family protein phosphatase [Desulfatitalea alkaliphila]
MTRDLPTARRRGLAFRLALFILTSTTLIYLVAFGYNYYCSRQVVIKNVRATAAQLAQAAVLRIESKLRAVEAPPRMVAGHLQARSLSSIALLTLMHDMVAGSPEIYGGAAAFEPHGFDPAHRYYAPYFFHTEEGRVGFTRLGGAYDYFLQDWYQVPRELERPVWSEPYFDDGGGGILMATYAHPFYDLSAGERVFHGVVTADISLEDLVAEIGAISIYETGYAFVISRNGAFLAHPDRDLIMRHSIFSVAEERGIPELRAVGREMAQGRSGFAAVTSVHTGLRSLLAYAPVPAADWAVGVMIPEEELLADIRGLNHTVLAIGALGFTVLFLVVVGISRSITRPLHRLMRTTTEIARGNLDAALPAVRTGDEVQLLTHSVDEMRLALKAYIADLTETTKAKERIESELKIARAIQMSFLPKHFPPFADQAAFDLFAALEPAKAVGGDLYDFFMLADGRLFFSVGDVSDKGVPAALFMAVSKTLMKGIAELAASPAEILARVNAELCPGNDSAMFVTVFCGILDLTTGELVYSNAGHNPPVLLRAGGTPEMLSLPPGMVLGVMEDAAFADSTVRLQAGDLLLLYTDGVTEAMDDAGRLFSDERLLDEMGAMPSRAPQPVVERLFAAVHAHAADAPQSDDITVLAMQYKGPAGV